MKLSCKPTDWLQGRGCFSKDQKPFLFTHLQCFHCDMSVTVDWSRHEFTKRKEKRNPYFFKIKLIDYRITRLFETWLLSLWEVDGNVSTWRNVQFVCIGCTASEQLPQETSLSSISEEPHRVALQHRTKITFAKVAHSSVCTMTIGCIQVLSSWVLTLNLVCVISPTWGRGSTEVVSSGSFPKTKWLCAVNTAIENSQCALVSQCVLLTWNLDY